VHQVQRCIGAIQNGTRDELGNPAIAFPLKEQEMKLLSAALLLTVVGLAAFPAAAQQEIPRGRDFRQGGRHGGMHQFAPGKNEQKDSFDPRFAGDASGTQSANEQRADQGQSPGQTSGRERLTPEERRQLRRDINAAGRDIYRQTRSE
jgi:hypothetical protein